MRLLLDSHTVLWAVYEPEKLSARAEEAISETGNELFVSLATLWELGNKAAVGRLPLVGTSVPQMIERIVSLGVTVLPITEAYVVAAAALPPHHLDPFDRMLISQAQANGLTLITVDSDMERYEVSILWR